MCYGRGLNSRSCAPYAKKKWEQFRLAVILWHETLNALFWHTIEWTRNSKSLNSNKFSASISHNQAKELSRAQSGLCSQAFLGWVLLAIMRRIKARALMLAFPLIVSTETSSLSVVSETSKLMGNIRKYQHRAQPSQSNNSVRSKLDSQAASEDGVVAWCVMPQGLFSSQDNGPWLFSNSDGRGNFAIWHKEKEKSGIHRRVCV